MEESREREKLRVMLSRNVVRAFIILALIFVALLGGLSYFIYQNGILAHRANDSAHQAQESARQAKVAAAQAKKAAQAGKDAKIGICSYKQGLKDGIGDTEMNLAKAKQYRAEHPNGTESISRELIDSSIKQQEATLARQQVAFGDLDVLHCEKDG